jgi:hypothetical protein
VQGCWELEGHRGIGCKGKRAPRDTFEESILISAERTVFDRCTADSTLPACRHRASKFTRPLPNSAMNGLG